MAILPIKTFGASSMHVFLAIGIVVYFLVVLKYLCILNKTASCLGEKQGMLVNNECSVRYSRVRRHF